MHRLGTVSLSILALAGLVTTATESARAVCKPDDPKAEIQRAIAQPHRLMTVARRIGKALDEGCYFGQEAEMARVVAPTWRGCPQDTETLTALDILFAPISLAIDTEDPVLARSLFVEAPLACLERQPEGWDRWFPRLQLLGEPEFAGAGPPTVSRLMKLAGNDPQRLGQVVRMLGDLYFFELPAFTPAQIDRLIDHAGDAIWRLPETFARIPGRAGVEALLRFAERKDFFIPPEVARDVDASRLRADALRRLEERELNAEDLRRLAELAASQDEWVARNATGVLVRHQKALRGLSLSGRVLDQLAYWMRVAGNGCRIAGIFATQGRPGAERLYAYWLKVQEGRARDCGWDLEQALMAAAPHLRTELVQRYRRTGNTRLIRFLVAAGETRLVAELARSAPDAETRREALRQLSLHLATNPKDAEAREALRRAAFQQLHSGAWETLLEVGDSEANWDRLLAMLRQEGPGRAELLEMLAQIHRPAPQPVLRALIDIALESTNRLERLRALEAARRTPEWAFRQFSTLDLPEEDRKETRAVLERAHALEPRVRALLEDPDEEVRRAAMAWFALVPGRDLETTEALFAGLGDPSDNVRAEAASALGRVQAGPPGIVARLEARATRDGLDQNLMEKVRVHLLRGDPEAMDRLVAIVLHRGGNARERKQLAETGTLQPPAAQALLARLDAEPMKAWLPKEGLSLPEIIAEIVAAGEDPLPWDLLSELVPDSMRNAWLVQKAVQAKSSWDRRLRLLSMVSGQTSEPSREQMRRLWIEAVQAGAVSPALFLDGFLRQFGYAGIQVLVDTFWSDPALLERLADLWIAANNLSNLRGIQTGTAGLPKPDERHLPWIAQRVNELAQTRDARRLRVFLTVADLYALGRDWKLRRAAYDGGITPALLRHIDDPAWCRAAQCLNALLGRMIPPKCGRP